MRTSNKIILATFISPLIILTALHLTLYAKYKSGHFTTMNVETQDQFIRLGLTHVMSVSVYGLDNLNIIPADSTKLEIEKQPNSRLSYVVSGDSLVIHGDSVVDKQGNSSRSYQSVNLYLPGDASIAASNSSVELYRRKDSTKAGAYRFHLTNESAFSIRRYEDATPTLFFTDLSFLASGDSKIELSSASHIGNMQLQLTATSFTDNGASIDSLRIVADKKSLITLKGDNISRLNK